ncbi:hypothetical protein GmHk_15G044800 [Glycine max]|nr:hypothetical protein GmHk_15G044800 [Glycine max]
MGLASQSSSTSSLMACNPIPRRSSMPQLVGKIKLKTPEEDMELIENMAANDHAILRDRAYTPTKKSLLELTAQDATLAQNKLLAQQIEALTETLSKLLQQLQAVSPSHSSIMQIRGCHIYSGAHEPGQCIAQEDSSREVNYKGGQNHHGFQGYNQGGPSGFNQGRNFTQGSTWRNHPGNQFTKEKGSQPAQNPKQGIDLYEKTSKLEETLNKFIQVSMSNHMSIEAAIKNLEIQVGQLAKQASERPTSSFGVKTEMKPKEECKVIFTEREKMEKKTEEDVHDEEGEKKEKRERNKEKAQQWEKCSQVKVQQKIILQVNTHLHQLIVKEERHGEHDISLSVILSLITNTSLAMI